jgi:hypothetical protein
MTPNLLFREEGTAICARLAKFLCLNQPYFGRGKIGGGVDQSALRKSLNDVFAGPRVPETCLFGTPKLERRYPATADRIGSSSGKIQTRERLGGLLKFYHREVA